MTDATSSFSLSITPNGPDSLGHELIHRRIHERLFGEPMPPVRLGRFIVEDTLGRGGMGAVYAARDERLGRPVAIKVIRGPRRGHVKHSRILAEARAQARLAHPNVVTVYEATESDDDVFIVMELVRGLTLDRWLALKRRSLQEVLTAFAGAGRGLAAAHAAGIVHRDVKPGNILIGDDQRVRIADFGLARAMVEEEHELQSSRRSARGSAIPPSSDRAAGTPAYMSPEHARGRPDARSDQFSFCVALYEALHGSHPFPERRAPSTSGPQPRLRFARTVPRWLRRLLTRGLSLHAEDRYPSMDMFLAAFEDQPPRSRWLSRGCIGGLLLAAAMGAAIYQNSGQGDSRDDFFAAHWNDERQRKIESALRATQLPYATEAWTRLKQAIDGFERRWTLARKQGPTWIHQYGERPRVLRYARQVCLERQRQAVAAVIDLYSTPLPTQTAGLDAVLDGLPDPVDCDNPAVLNRPPDLSEDLQALLARAQRLQRSGLGRDALPLLTELISASQAEGSSAGEAEALLLRADIEARELGDAQSADNTLKDALQRATKHGHDAITWRILNALAMLSADEFQDVEQARRQHRLASDVFRRLSLTSPLSTAALLDTESFIALLEGRPDRALALRRRALQLREGVLSLYSPELARSHLDVINALAETDPRTAQAKYEELAALHRRTFGPSHPLTARTEFNAAQGLFLLGSYPEARRTLLHCRAVFLKNEGPLSPRVAVTDLYLARIAEAQGDRTEAEHRGRMALAVYDVRYPPAFSERVETLVVLIEQARLARRWEEVLALGRQLLELHGQAEMDLDLPGLLTTMGDSLCLLKRCAEAAHYYHDLAELIAHEDPHNLALRAYALQGLGQIDAAAGKTSRAKVRLEQALGLLEADPESSPQMLAQTARSLARLLVKMRRQPGRARQLIALADATERVIGETPQP